MNRRLLDFYGTEASKLMPDFWPKYDPRYTSLTPDKVLLPSWTWNFTGSWKFVTNILGDNKVDIPDTLYVYTFQKHLHQFCFRLAVRYEPTSTCNSDAKLAKRTSLVEVFFVLLTMNQLTDVSNDRCLCKCLPLYGFRLSHLSQWNCAVQSRSIAVFVWWWQCLECGAFVVFFICKVQRHVSGKATLGVRLCVLKMFCVRLWARAEQNLEVCVLFQVVEQDCFCSVYTNLCFSTADLILMICDKKRYFRKKTNFLFVPLMLKCCSSLVKQWQSFDKSFLLWLTCSCSLRKRFQPNSHERFRTRCFSICPRGFQQEWMTKDRPGRTHQTHQLKRQKLVHSDSGQVQKIHSCRKRHCVQLRKGSLFGGAIWNLLGHDGRNDRSFKHSIETRTMNVWTYCDLKNGKVSIDFATECISVCYLVRNASSIRGMRLIIGRYWTVARIVYQSNRTL